MTKITITEDDITAAIDAFHLAARWESPMGDLPSIDDCLRAVCHALAERWSQPALDPVVTERLGKIIEESEK